MNIAIVCGSIRPTYCGIGKFTDNLITQIKLADNGKRIEKWFYLTNKTQSEFNPGQTLGKSIYTQTRVNLKSVSSIKNLFNFVKTKKPDRIWIQYQTFGKNIFDSIFPLVCHLANKKSKVSVFIHEFGIYSNLGKLRLYLAMLLADQVLFSDSQQMLLATKKSNLKFRYLENWLQKKIKNKSSQVIIGPNVTRTNRISKIKKTDQVEFVENNPELNLNIVFHGLIQENKGLHLLLQALNQFNHPFKLHILGVFKPLLGYTNLQEVINYQKKWEEYIKIHSKLADNTIIYGDIEPGTPEFTKVLDSSELAIFPFLDYATMRRTSLANSLVSSKNTLFATTLNLDLSETILCRSLFGFKPDVKSLLGFLNEYVFFDKNKKTLQFVKQRELIYYLDPENIGKTNYSILFPDTI